jgi:hypothetical protein
MKNLSSALRAIRELRPCYELKYKLESEERKHRVLPKDGPAQKSGSIGAQHPEDVYRSAQILTLRLHIRCSGRRLGEETIISKPDDLDYLQEQDAILSARLETRNLLIQSAGLARVPTCDGKKRPDEATG